MSLLEPYALQTSLARHEPAFPRAANELLARARKQEVAHHLEALGETVWPRLLNQAEGHLRRAQRRVRAEMFRTIRGLTPEKRQDIASGTNLLHKLSTNFLTATADQASKTLHALFRARIIEMVLKKISQAGFSATTLDILSLYRVEGDLSVPMSVWTSRLQAYPDKPVIPKKRAAGLMLGVNHTGHLRPTIGTRAVRELTARDIARSRITPLIRDSRTRKEWLDRMQQGKQWGLLIFMLLVAGLDFYVANPREGSERAKKTFRYVYARSRVRAADKPVERDQLEAYLEQGGAVYDELVHIDEMSYFSGISYAYTGVKTLVLGWYPGEVHVLPIEPIRFTATLLTEGVMRFLGMQRAPLIFDPTEKKFDPPLPPSVTYIRYNAWDIYLVLLIMDVLDAVVNQKRNSRIPEESRALRRLRKALDGFGKEMRPDVWEMLEQWHCNPNYELRDESLRRRRKIRVALIEDAQRPVRQIVKSGIPGPKEKALHEEVRKVSGVAGAVELFHEISKQGLWNDVEAAMMSHIGPGRQPWMGSHFISDFFRGRCRRSARPRLGLEVAKNARRYYYVSKGYAWAITSAAGVESYERAASEESARLGEEDTKKLLQSCIKSAPEWNFTPSDYSKLKGRGRKLVLHKSSYWLPFKLRQNLLNTLHYLLDESRIPLATEGVNICDLYHGHLVALKKAEKPHLEEGMSMSSALKAYTDAANETLKIQGAAVVYHTFEFYRPTPMKEGAPRRNYMTPLSTNIPEPYTPPDINSAFSILTRGGYSPAFTFDFLINNEGVVYAMPRILFDIGLKGGLEAIVGRPINGRARVEDIEEFFRDL